MKNNVHLIDINPLMMHGLSHTVPNSCFYGTVISTLMLYSLLMCFSICSNTSSKGWIMLDFKLVIKWKMMLLVNISRVDIFLLLRLLGEYWLMISVTKILQYPASNYMSQI